MTKEEMETIAVGNIERNVDIDENASPDAIYDEVYTLAFDALHDAGVARDDARKVAGELAMRFAAP